MLKFWRTNRCLKDGLQNVPVISILMNQLIHTQNIMHSESLLLHSIALSWDHFYRPPHSPLSIWNELSHSVQQIQYQFSNAIILLGGEFNCPRIEWSSNSLIDNC